MYKIKVNQAGLTWNTSASSRVTAQAFPCPLFRAHQSPLSGIVARVYPSSGKRKSREGERETTQEATREEGSSGRSITSPTPSSSSIALRNQEPSNREGEEQEEHREEERLVGVEVDDIDTILQRPMMRLILSAHIKRTSEVSQWVQERWIEIYIYRCRRPFHRLRRRITVSHDWQMNTVWHTYARTFWRRILSVAAAGRWRRHENVQFTPVRKFHSTLFLIDASASASVLWQIKLWRTKQWNRRY